MGMRRRGFIIGVSGLAAGLAGCTTGEQSGGADGTAGNTDSPTPTSRATATATDSPEIEFVVATPHPGIVHNNVEYKPLLWDAVEYFRYWNEETESLGRLYPDNDWWLVYSVTIENLGGDTVTLPEYDDATLWASGEPFKPVDGIPVSTDNLRLRDEYFAMVLRNLSSPYRPETLEAGKKTGLDFLFDTQADDEPELELNTPDGESVTFD